MKTIKKQQACKQLESSQKEKLARYIISQVRRDIHSGVNRKKRITAPSGTVILF
jgi:hypothetical protein